MSTFDVTWDATCATVENADGARIPPVSLRYNATISALEIRVIRYPDALTYLAKLGKGPMIIRVQHPDVADGREEVHAIHFEDARLAFPVESEAGDGVICSVFVLRGLRIETR